MENNDPQQASDQTPLSESQREIEVKVDSRKRIEILTYFFGQTKTRKNNTQKELEESSKRN